MPYIKLEKNISNEKINYLLKNGTTFVGAFSKTCPHCINMQSEWKKFISIVKEKKIKATILEIDSNILTSIKNPLINSNVEGFPSLFVVKNNKFIAHYNQERKANNFLQFLNKYVYKLPTKNTRKVRPKMRTRKSFLTIKNRYKSL
jgi:hypothetical protein